MNIGKSFAQTVLSSEITNLSSELSETFLDSMLEDGLLKDIPIIGSVLTLYRIGASMKERIYIKKLYKVLYELHAIPEKDRKQFIEEFSDEKEKSLFFEKLLFLIDRQDDVNKSTIAGKLFSKYIEGHIIGGDFLRCITLIDKVYIDDLYYLNDRGWEHSTTYNGAKEYTYTYDEMVNDNLEFAGILIAHRTEFKLPEYLGFSQHKLEYSLSKMGEIILKWGF